MCIKVEDPYLPQEACAIFGKGGVFVTHTAHERGGAYNSCVCPCVSVCVYVYTKVDLGLVIGDCLEISSMVCLLYY